MGEHERSLRAIREALPPVPHGEAAASTSAVNECLAQRDSRFRERIGDYYAGQYRGLVEGNLKADHSYRVMFAHAQLLDALLLVTLDVALDELPLLLHLRQTEDERELAFKLESLPKKALQAESLREQLATLPAGGESHGERAYLERIAGNASKEAAEAEQAVARLRRELPELKAFRAARRDVLRRLVLFARGGYGRAELSFSSDLDVGYCIDPRGLAPGVLAVYRECVLRAEQLINHAGVTTVHQYFEVNEDFSRFTLPQTIHTLPAILEARLLAGNPALFAELRQRFFEIMPFEAFVNKKVEEYEAQPLPGLTAMHLKGDRGGIRSVQIPMWLFGVAHQARSFMTADLMELAIQKGMLSFWEAARLLQALELLNELRNFVGAGAQHYAGGALTGAQAEAAFPEDQVAPSWVGLYVARKRRFASLEAFQAIRLRTLGEVQTITRRLLERVLDRTASHWLGEYGVSVHLGRKRILRLHGRNPKDAVAPIDAFRRPQPLLELFCFIARTGYDLSDELKDGLAIVVASLGPAADERERSERAELWSRIMGGPFAHRALRTLFEIGDPLTPGAETLIGRFLPEANGLFFLLADVPALGMPVHEHLLRGVAEGQRVLDGLWEKFPEWHGMIEARHVLAVKWSLFLNGLGRIEPDGDVAARSARMAGELLRRLGYGDEELIERVQLLIQHHRTLVVLGRTSTYIDQALAEYFELANRQLINVILLFTVNMAVVRADGETAEHDVVTLQLFFDEASRILGEARAMPGGVESLDAVINLYFDQKKERLMVRTRLNLLLHQSLTVGLDAAVFAPLAELSAREAERLRGRRDELMSLHREIVLGAPEGRDHERLEARVLSAFEQVLGETTVKALLGEEEGTLSWLFASFPNRYLLTDTPQHLASQVLKFGRFRTSQVLVDVVPVAHTEIKGLLLFTRNLRRSHTRVAYALSRRRLNILSGKVNRVEFGAGDHGYCYFFQITTLVPGTTPLPRDLELLVMGEQPPEHAGLPGGPGRKAVRVAFAGIDGKGYRVEPVGEGFARHPAPYPHIRLELQDEPFLFYKVSRAFDHHDVEIQQSLITTTGTHVVDYFYLREGDFTRLRETGFADTLTAYLSADLFDTLR